jgi:integrase
MPAKSILRLNFTKTELAKLPIPDSGYVVNYDTTVEGLVLLVYATAAKRFYVYKKVDGKPTRIRIGKFPDISVELARKEAQQILGAIAQGEKPIARSRRKEPTIQLDDLLKRYITEYAQHHCTTWQETEKSFRRCFRSWLLREVSTITRADIQQHMNVLGEERGQHTANRAFDDLRAVISWGIKYDHVTGINPCVGVIKFKTQSRERFIHPQEFSNFLTKLRESKNIDIRDYTYLSLFTGARQANVLAMRWDEIDFDLCLWRIPKTKNSKSHTIPLTVAAIAVLNERKERITEPWVFPSKTSAIGHLVEPKIGWRQLLKDAQIEDLRMHDLRRTLGSYMAMGNQSLHIIGKALGHQSHTSTQIYARLAHDPIRQAMEKAQADMMLAAGLVSPADFISAIAGHEPAAEPILELAK